ncbi:MAG: 2-amino-4-hydroxy-6-hydroxymethyldihydropteridine diphosphokinase [Sphingobium sp.]|nr:2-amino-4-hydroxy-6-hydroxymethyldihydropteridine diphosphokinase [Sphingobium sp.]
MERNARESGKQPLHLYAIGIGSNRPLSRHLTPRAIVHAAMAALDLPPFSVVARAPVIVTAPVGPSMRRYANSAAIVASPLAPEDMLGRLQELEARFGRRRYRRWGARTLDLDMLLWSGGAVNCRRLTIPHKLFRTRGFVLRPLAAIAPRWRDPATGFSVAQLAARLRKTKAVRI